MINCKVENGNNIILCEDKNILIAGGHDFKLYLYNLNDVSTEEIKPYQIIQGTNQWYLSTLYIPKYDLVIADNYGILQVFKFNGENDGLALNDNPTKIITSKSGAIFSMRYIQYFNILVTGSWKKNNKNITVWSVPEFNELN